MIVGSWGGATVFKDALKFTDGYMIELILVTLFEYVTRHFEQYIYT